MRLKNPLHGFKYAAEGVVHVFRTQRHMKFHFLTMVGVLMISLLWPLKREEIMVLMFTITLVLVAEMFNTAVEAVVDLVTQSYHPLAKFAKDIAAGAVLISTMNALIIGFLLFFGGNKWSVLSQQVKIKEPPDPLTISVVGMILLLAMALMWKVSGGKGKMWHGGVVSGHSAIGFFLAVTVYFLSGRLAAAIVALLMAVLIAQSRVEARIHTIKEVIAGALLGSGMTVLVYYLAGSHLPWAH